MRQELQRELRPSLQEEPFAVHTADTVPDEGDHGLVTASLIDYSVESNAPRIINNLERLLTLKGVYFIGDLQFVLLLHLVPVLMWQYLPVDLRRLYYATPLFIIPMLLAGNIWEVRIFAEILPLASVALFAAAGAALRTAHLQMVTV